MKKFVILAIVFIMTNMVAQNYCNAQPKVKAVDGTQKKTPNTSSQNSNSIIEESNVPVNGKSVVQITLKINGKTNIFRKYSGELGDWERTEITKDANSSSAFTSGAGYLTSDNNSVTFSLSTDNLNDLDLKVDLNLKKVFVLKGKEKIKSTVLLVSAIDTVGNAKPIVGKSIKLGRLEIAQHDFPSPMMQSYAKEECEMLGNGWRLPTKDELNLLYKNKGKIGGFFDSKYLCSSLNNDRSGDLWSRDAPLIVDFKNGVGEYASMSSKNYYFRAVRSIR
jgi:hypothetical protein